MTRQARLRWALACCLLGLAVPLTGCGRTAPLQDKDGNRPEEDPLDLPRSIVSKASAPADYYAALELINKHLNNQPETLARFEPADRTAFGKLLTERVALDDDELNEVNAGRFTPLDSHYLAYCFLLRDAAHSLRLPAERLGASAAEKTALALQQTRLAFDWTVRQVLLEEKASELRPPHFVLHEGRGGSRERMLIFLTLLQQFGLDGCVIAFPGENVDTPAYRLAGVLLPGDSQIYLFDARLGIPVPGPGGKGVATLAQLRDPKAQKEVFAQLNVDGTYQYDITPEQAARAEVHLVFPLSSLSARMRYLEEEVFAAHDRVHLALQPAAVFERFETAKVGPIKVWNRRSVVGKPRPLTPTRVARIYLPQEEGGIANKVIYHLHKENLNPWPPIMAALYEMRIYKQLPDAAGERQIRFSLEQLFRKYVRTPWDNLLHGRLDAASRPLDQLLTALDHPALTPADEALFQQQVDTWRQRAMRVFVDIQKPGGRKLSEDFWAEDQYLLQLVTAGNSDGELDLKKVSPTMLSKIVVRAAGEQLRRDATYLQALRWQEKADRAQAKREQLTGARGKKAAADAEVAWENAADKWGLHTHLFPFTSATLKARLQQAQALTQRREPELGRAMLEYSFHDLRRSLTARLWHAQALTMWGGKEKQALAALRELDRQMAAMETTTELQTLRNEIRDQVPNEAQRKHVEANLFGDFQPRGSFFWLHYRTQLELRRLSPK